MEDLTLENDVQSLLFNREGVSLCRFECPASHARWSQNNRIVDGYNLAFPKRLVEIEPAGQTSFVVDPTQVVFYNLGQSYRRRQFDEQGDHSNLILFRRDHIVSALDVYDREVSERREPFRFHHGPLVPSAHLRQLELFRTESLGLVEPEEVIETSLELLDVTLQHTYELRGREPVRQSPTDSRPQVEEVKRLIGLGFESTIRLDDLAQAVGLSVYHLCRVFRRQTGLPIYRFVQQRRLYKALEELLDSSRSLVEIALDTGFSSQSHFTESFRKVYGITPGRLRRRHRLRAWAPPRLNE